MDLDSFTMEDMLLSAIKSEVEARDIYLEIARNVENAFLSDKLRFIADEEEKHKEYLESVYKMQFQKEIPDLPKESPVPLPEVKITGKMVQASDIMGQAMESETAASDFYESLAMKFEDEEIRTTLQYLAKMEIGHFKMLEIEKEVLESQEDYEFEWGMMHVGP